MGFSPVDVREGDRRRPGKKVPGREEEKTPRVFEIYREREKHTNTIRNEQTKARKARGEALVGDGTD